MLNTINYAKEVYYNDKQSWYGIMERAMQADYSWQKSAEKYQELYNCV